MIFNPFRCTKKHNNLCLFLFMKEQRFQFKHNMDKYMNAFLDLLYFFFICQKKEDQF